MDEYINKKKRKKRMTFGAKFLFILSVLRSASSIAPSITFGVKPNSVVALLKTENTNLHHKFHLTTSEFIDFIPNDLVNQFR